MDTISRYGGGETQSLRLYNRRPNIGQIMIMEILYKLNKINRCIEKLLIFVRLNYKIGKKSKNLKYNCLLIF